MLSDAEITLVRDSFAKVAPIKDEAATMFYARLFEIAPSMQPMFPDDLTEQKQKLMAMIAAAVNGLTDLPNLVPVVKMLGARHAGYGVKPAHYRPVATALLWTLEQGLGSAFTPETKEAWTKVYGVLAETMMAGAEEAGGVRVA